MTSGQAGVSLAALRLQAPPRPMMTRGVLSGGQKRAALGAHALRTPASCNSRFGAKNHRDISYEGLAALVRMRTMVRSASRAWMAARRASSRSAESLAEPSLAVETMLPKSAEPEV